MIFRKKKSVNINQYKTKQEFNIGMLIFILILLYLIVTLVTYATSKRISTYEVRKGSIVKDNSYTGLILRQEKVAYAEAEGYISYFRNENSKVNAGSNIYAISSEMLDTEASAEAEDLSLGEDVQKNLSLKTQNFNENFDPQKFSSVYTLKGDLTEILRDASNQSKMAHLDLLAAQNHSGVHVYQSASDGVLVQTIDGYEGLTEETLKPSDFDRTSYGTVRLEDQAQLHTGDAVYKLVTSEEWCVYIELDENQVKELSDISFIKTRIDKDNEALWAEFSILRQDGHYFGKLVFDHSMIRYAKDRFLNIELILEQESGLKIPKSSVIEKEFYVVPVEYMTSNENGTMQGFLIKEEGEAVFHTEEIYHITEDGEVYLNPGDFEQNTTFVKPGTSETCQLKEKKSLKGVYSINKGYTVFKQVTILCENEDYYIIDEGVDYSLSNYDHIVLDGSMVEASEVVFQ